MADVRGCCPTRRATVFGGLMELGATVCTARKPGCGRVRCARADGGGATRSHHPPRRVQRFAGTDRQVRGRLIDVLRGNERPVARAQLDWMVDDTGQRNRALDSLLVDGLVELTEDGLFALAGEGIFIRRLI